MTNKEKTTLNDYLVEAGALNGGAQRLFRFPNGLGASVVQHAYSYGGSDGLWEVAVIKWGEAGFRLTYDTPITDDVLGYLTDEEVDETLILIMELEG